MEQVNPKSIEYRTQFANILSITCSSIGFCLGGARVYNELYSRHTTLSAGIHKQAERMLILRGSMRTSLKFSAFVIPLLHVPLYFEKIRGGERGEIVCSITVL